MHPRNIYKTPPNFKQMAIDYPEFRKHVTTVQVNQNTLLIRLFTLFNIS